MGKQQLFSVLNGATWFYFIASTVVSCGHTDSSQESCAAGTERCECYRNDTCNDGLTCLSSRCVKFEPESGSAGASGSDATGGKPATTKKPSGTEDSENGGAGTGGGESNPSTTETAQGGASSSVVSSTTTTVNASGGSTATSSMAIGGKSSAGGNSGTGGKSSSGGTSAGGATVTSSTATGGKTSTGGSTGTGGKSTSTGGTSTGGSAQGGSSAMGGSCSRGGTGSYIIYDDFECGPALWSPQPASAFSVVVDGSNTYAVTTIINSLSYATIGNVMTANYRVEAKVKVLSFSSGAGWRFVGLFGDFVSSLTYSSVTLSSDGKVAAGYLRNGGGADASDPENVFTVGQWYTLGLEREGKASRMYLDGKLVGSWLADTVPSGRIAIGTYNATARFDDVRVTPL